VSAPTEQQLEALKRLWVIAQRDTGQARVVFRFLVGLYNGPRFPFDLTDLRLLDDAILNDVMAVLWMDSRPQSEVHELLNRALGRRDVGQWMELHAYEWRLKNRCAKAYYLELCAELRGGSKA